jgi:hypothetical protein
MSMLQTADATASTPSNDHGWTACDRRVSELRVTVPVVRRRPASYAPMDTQFDTQARRAATIAGFSHAIRGLFGRIPPTGQKQFATARARGACLLLLRSLIA